MAKSTSEFVNFIREQGVVGLATGLAIGVSAGKAVEAIVDGLINPIIGYIVGGSDLNAEKLNVVAPKYLADGVTIDTTQRYLQLGWGMVVSGVIVLVATAFVVFYIVRSLGLDKIDKKKD